MGITGGVHIASLLAAVGSRPGSIQVPSGAYAPSMPLLLGVLLAGAVAAVLVINLVKISAWDRPLPWEVLAVRADCGHYAIVEWLDGEQVARTRCPHCAAGLVVRRR